MKPNRASRLMLALAFAGASFAAAAQTIDEDHETHHPDAAVDAPASRAPASPAAQARPDASAPVAPGPRAARAQAADGRMPPAYSVPALQQRMKSIRNESDPAHRLALIEEQIRALEAATEAAANECPIHGGMMHPGMMPGAGKAAGPMDGRGMTERSMPRVQPGTSAAPRMPPGPEMMREHMRMMERHMNMMEQMMRMHGQMHPEPAQR